MANDTSGLFQTLVAAATMASENVKFRNAFLSTIYWDYRPVEAAVGRSLEINIPTVSEGDVTDIGSGDLQPTDTDHDNVTITLDKHFSSSWIIKSWDQIRTPENLATKYLQPRLEALKRKMNRSIAQLITTTNFATHTLISGSSADVFDRADIASAWQNLFDAGVPVDDTANMAFVTNGTAYGKMLAATAFTSEAVVGVNASEASLQRAVLFNQYGAMVIPDQHIAVYNSGKQPGIFFHRHAIAGVTANPPSSGPGIDEMSMMVGTNVPVQFQAQYNMLKQGWVFNLRCFWGVKVVRAAYGSLLETA